MSTDAQGQAAFSGLQAGRYRVAAAKDGFQPTRRDGLEVTASGEIALELTMVPVLTHSDSVEVRETANAVELATSAPVTLSAQNTKDLPNRPATVADALPLVPGVLREPGGGLTISASAEHRSAMVVNSTDVTDPATGQFGLTVPIDSVETMNVYQTPFLAEYGRFTAGLVSVETRRGGEKWKWELNDPLPDFYIRSFRLRGLKDATPRFNFEGPLVPGKLYFSEGMDYEIRKIEVYELPFPYNQKKQAGVNSFAQMDWVISGKHLFTATVHMAPQRLENVNIDYFNPEPTSPDARTSNFTGVLADHLTIFGGVLESNFSVTRFAPTSGDRAPRISNSRRRATSGIILPPRTGRRYAWAALRLFPLSRGGIGARTTSKSARTWPGAAKTVWSISTRWTFWAPAASCSKPSVSHRACRLRSPTWARPFLRRTTGCWARGWLWIWACGWKRRRSRIRSAWRRAWAFRGTRLRARARWCTRGSAGSTTACR